MAGGRTRGADRRQANIFLLFLQVNSKNNCIYQKKLKGNLPDKDMFMYVTFCISGVCH